MLRTTYSIIPTMVVINHRIKVNRISFLFLTQFLLDGCRCHVATIHAPRIIVIAPSPACASVVSENQCSGWVLRISKLDKEGIMTSRNDRAFSVTAVSMVVPCAMYLRFCFKVKLAKRMMSMVICKPRLI